MGTERAEGTWLLHAAAGFDAAPYFVCPSFIAMAALSFIGYARTVPHTHLCADSGLSESQFLLFRIRMYDTEVFWRVLTLSSQQFNSQMVRVTNLKTLLFVISDIAMVSCSVLNGYRNSSVSFTPFLSLINKMNPIRM